MCLCVCIGAGVCLEPPQLDWLYKIQIQETTGPLNLNNLEMEGN